MILMFIGENVESSYEKIVWEDMNFVIIMGGVG